MSSDIFRKVYFKIWQDKKFRQLSPPAPSAQHLWLYLLTGRHTVIVPGVIPYGPHEIEAALGWRQFAMLGDDWKPANGCRTADDAFTELIDLEMLHVDEAAPLIWLPNALKYNPPAGPNGILSWRETWGRLPESHLIDEIAEHFRVFFKDKGANWLAAFEVVLGNATKESQGDSEPSAKGSRNGSPKGSAKGSRDSVSSKQGEVSRDLGESGRSATAEKPSPSSKPSGGNGELFGEPPADKKPTAYQSFVARFTELFREHRGEDPEWGQKQGAQVKRLLKKRGGLAGAIARAERMFAMAPKWPAENPDLMTLVGHWDKFAPSPKSNVGGHRIDPKTEYVEGDVEL